MASVCGDTVFLIAQEEIGRLVYMDPMQTSVGGTWPFIQPGRAKQNGHILQVIGFQEEQKS